MAIRLVRGSPFEERVTALIPWLQALAFRLTRSASDAQDLVQDTIERAFLRAHTFEPNSHLRAWLSSILQHLFIDRTRRRHLEPQSLDGVDAAVPSPESTEPLWARLDEGHVRAALSSLPVEFRDVFELHLDGLSYQDIAARLNVPRPTVGTRLLRARKLLRALLIDEGKVR